MKKTFEIEVAFTVRYDVYEGDSEFYDGVETLAEMLDIDIEQAKHAPWSFVELMRDTGQVTPAIKGRIVE